MMRIDPNGGGDGLGAVDLTVGLGANAYPYNYSDMTGIVAIGSTSPQGTWSVVHDAGASGNPWGIVTWNTEPEGSEPPGTSITVEARAADSEAGLGGESFIPVSNGIPFDLVGRFIEVRATLQPDQAGISPVLSDLTIEGLLVVCDVDGDGDVDRFDISAIFAARNTQASGPDDPRDANGDGIISVNDARECVLECTNPRCAP